MYVIITNRSKFSNRKLFHLNIYLSICSLNKHTYVYVQRTRHIFVQFGVLVHFILNMDDIILFKKVFVFRYFL